MNNTQSENKNFELAEELWDKYSETIDDDIDSLQMVAGHTILRKLDYFRLMEEALPAHPVEEKEGLREETPQQFNFYNQLYEKLRKFPIDAMTRHNICKLVVKELKATGGCQGTPGRT